MSLSALLVQPVGEPDVARPGHQQAEGDGLRIAVGELLIVRFGKEELPPIGGQCSEGRALLGQLFGDFITQQAAEPRRDPGKLRGRLWRNRFPAKKIIEPRDEFGRGGEFRSRRFDIALQLYDGADEFAVLPKAKRVAVGVQQVGERLQLLLLFLVVPFVASWIGAFTGRLDFDEAHEHVSQCDGVIGSTLERGKRRFADRREPLSFEAAKFREIGEELF